MPLIAGFGMLIHTKSRRTKTKKMERDVSERRDYNFNINLKTNNYEKILQL